MRLVLVPGDSDRALALTRDLVAEGHAVRAVIPRDDDGAARERVEAAGGEPWPGDPDVVGTLRYALENAALLLWLLGDDPTPELHADRLAMMLERTIDTTVRGVVYEVGADGEPAFAQGVATIERVAGFNEIPYRLVALGGDLRAAVDDLLQTR